MTIDRNAAAQALSEIDDIAARVRQSRIYNLTSLILFLIGYFFIGAHFELSMAFVNGGGLVPGGLWMRRN